MKSVTIRGYRVARIHRPRGKGRLRWTPKTGPKDQLWFCGFDPEESDQTNENKTEAKEAQCNVQGEGGDGGDAEHQNGGAVCARVRGASRAGEPVEDGAPGTPAGARRERRLGRRGQPKARGRSAPEDRRADGGPGLPGKKVPATGSMNQRRELVAPQKPMSIRDPCGQVAKNPVRGHFAAGELAVRQDFRPRRGTNLEGKPNTDAAHT